MVKRFFAGAFASAALFLGAGMYSLSACATTVEDVIEVARHYGYSEDLIQQGFNKYYENPELYTSDDFDLAIEKLHEAGHSLITVGPQIPVTTQPQTTTNITTAVSSPSSQGAVGDTTTTISTGGGASDAQTVVTITMKDGTTFTRISRKEFIKLSYDEKMNYLRTFTPDQQQAIIDDLSPEEYRSLLKQAPTDTKVDVIDNLSQAMGTMGVSVSINEISDEKLALDLRNENGELIGVANAGVIVEDTGYDRSLIVKTAAVLFAAAAGVLALVLHKFRSKEKIGESNEG